MFSKDEIKQNMIGCFEILLFMTKGFDRFTRVTARDAIKSFIFPIALMPVALSVHVITAEEGYDTSYIVSAHLMRTLLSAGTYLGIVYYFSKLMNRQEHFAKYLVIANWGSIIGIILVSPILLYVYTGADVSAVENYPIFITVIGIFYRAFIMTNVFKIPWEMGGFMAIIGLGIGETMWDLMLYLFGDIVQIDGR